MKYNVLKIIELIFVNLITMTRLLGAFVLPFIYIYKGPSISSIVILILFLTDAIDGFLARTFKISTFLGSMLDAISDKLLNTVSFILLGLTYNIMIPPLILEILILLISYSTYRYGGNVQSSKVGKIKTIILDICVIFSFVLISLNAFNTNNHIINYFINNVTIYINIFGSIISISCIIALLDYTKKYKKVRNNPKNKKISFKGRTRKTFKELIMDGIDTNYYTIHKDESILEQFYK